MAVLKTFVLPAVDQKPAPPKVGSSMTYAERYATGKALRETCPERHTPSGRLRSNRRDAVQQVLDAEKGRMPELLPLRHGRMARSAFTFYRGAALTMAADLASTPSTGVRVQCCGDAHLSNFGGFATPERKIIFSINDLDETLPAPWEWDLKRLAASFIVACRDNGVSDSTAKDVATTCARTYRESTTEFSSMKMLELWYYALGPDELMGMTDMDIRKRVMKRIEQERAKSTAEEIYPKLVEHKGDIADNQRPAPYDFSRQGLTSGRSSARDQGCIRRVSKYALTVLPVPARPL